MVAILSSVNINQIYRALAHDVDIINAHKNNSIFNRLDKAVEGQGANFDISNSLYELIIAARTATAATAATAAGSGPAAATAAATAAAQYKANVDDILKNQSGPSGLGAIKTYSDLTKHIPLSLIFYFPNLNYVCGFSFHKLINIGLFNTNQFSSWINFLETFCRK